jgi:hypothetical protein
MTWKKLVSQKILLQQTKLTACFFPRHASERNSERFAISSNLRLLLILFHGTEFRVGFSSAELFGTEFPLFASIFVPRYRTPNIFLLCGVVRNRIPRVSCSAEQLEFRRNKPIVSSIPSSSEKFFCRKLSTLAVPKWYDGNHQCKPCQKFVYGKQQNTIAR